MSETIAQVRDFLIAGFAVAPVLMFGLAALCAVPLLVAGGLVLKRQSQRRGHLPRAANHSEIQDGPTVAWRTESPAAALSRAGTVAGRLSADHPILRIGRQDDNDICIDADTVHRYHALVHRAEDGRYWLVDVSGPDGNGVTVDGRRASRVRLRGGESIEIGGTVLTFDMKRKSAEAVAAG